MSDTGVSFTHHNIRLDNGSWTVPAKPAIEENHVATSVKRVLQVVFPGDRKNIRVADLGCLEGGYSVAMARMGFSVLGIEVRESNYAACLHVKKHVNLPNLEFVRDDAWNIKKHGPFDAVFCCGLLYHIDRPKAFLQNIADVTSRLLYLQTHFSTDRPNKENHLSEMDTNEGLKGRWFTEFENEKQFKNREGSRWASWDNSRSFWIKREYLLQTIRDIGFDTVFEQFDHFGKDMAKQLSEGSYITQERGSFIGIKTGIERKLV